jgi:hypothetical protein
VSHASTPEVNWAEQLEYYGYSVHSEADLGAVQAIDREDIKQIALFALRDEYGVAAAPKITLFLQDEDLGTRALAAKLLAEMKPEVKSPEAMAAMKEDFRKLVPATYDPADTSIFRSFVHLGILPLDVVETALALAKMGDADVGPFVQAAALHGPTGSDRHSAVEALVALLQNVDAEELKRRGLDPAGTLVEVARKETSPGVFMRLQREVRVGAIPPAVSETILLLMRESQNPEVRRRWREKDLIEVRERLQRAAATQPAASGSSTSRPASASAFATTRPEHGDSTTDPDAPVEAKEGHEH